MIITCYGKKYYAKELGKTTTTAYNYHEGAKRGYGIGVLLATKKCEVIR